MYVIKAFGTHSAFADNTVGVTNPIGEISTYSLTFSKEKGYYAKDSIPAVSLISFKSENNGTPVVIDPTIRDELLSIVQWTFNKSINTAGQIYADQFIAEITTAFTTTALDFKCGEVITNGTKWIPEWVSWKLKSNSDSFIRIWFSDPSFRAKYDEYEIVVIPPLDVIDDFFKVGSEVQALLEARSMSELIEIAQIARNKHPESVMRTDTYKYLDPLTSSRKLDTLWTTLIYGPMGNNIDSIKDALVDYILANSAHTRAEWTAIFPDIFKRTEFILTPNWGKMAIPNRSNSVGIYSAISNLTEANALIKQYAPGYSVAHINTYGSVMGHPYKSLSVTSIGSVENRDNLFSLVDVYPDYIMVSSTSQDFNRMSEDTREWAAGLFDMLIAAEEMGEFTDVPQGMTRVKRNGLLYVVKSFKNIHYLVTLKANFPATP